jgi:DNA-binding NtrC family response regulator
LTSRILLALAEDTFADRLFAELTEKGFDVGRAKTTTAAMDFAQSGEVAAMIVGGWPRDEELELTRRVRALWPSATVFMAGGDNDPTVVVESIKAGADDYVLISSSAAEVVGRLATALAAVPSGPEADGVPDASQVLEDIIGRSAPMQRVFERIKKVAGSDSTVLVLGESGTGKELIARAIHALSARSSGPLIPVNCGAIPEELLESELFGHEKGAFTGAIKTRLGRFELAKGGTIFLDEVGDMSPNLQVKLLRVLQDHQFERIGGTRTIKAEIRVIAATNQDVKTKVDEGLFREDLYYRLNVIPIRLPSLRDKLDDLPSLAEHFVDNCAARMEVPRPRISASMMDLFLAYDWPGNVRELENVIERLVILSEGDELSIDELPARIKALEPGAAVAPVSAAGCIFTFPEPGPEGLSFNDAVDRFERRLIDWALEASGGVKNRAAVLLGLNRTTLVEKIRKKGIKGPG